MMIKLLVAEFARWIYWHPWRFFIQLIPTSWSYRLAVFAGRCHYWFAIGKRQRVLNGLKYFFPDANESILLRIVKNTFRNYALNSIEIFLYPKLDSKKINRMVHYIGLEKLDAALHQHRGVILAHGHFGNEEFLMPAIGYQGYKLHQIASRWNPPAVQDTFYGRIINAIRNRAFRYRIGYREQLPVTFHYIDKPLRGAVRAIQNNEVVLFAADGRESEQWLELDFLGQRARFSPGLARFAKLTGAIVLPVFLIREKDFRHRLIIEDQMEMNDKDDTTIMKEYIARLEKYIRQYPCHYAKVYWIEPSFFIQP
ncbi:MAG: hypothetical protein N3A72_01640 [bacterium]|nr:hypothetical protein [bacterium]